MSEPVFVDPREPDNRRGKGGSPSLLATECAVSIANYCLTRFPCDTPPHPMLDVPWFAEKVQACIDEACRIGRKLKRELEKADSEIADLKLLLIRKNEALSIFASTNMWNKDFGCNDGESLYTWNGADVYANPMALAQREMQAEEPCDNGWPK